MFIFCQHGCSVLYIFAAFSSWINSSQQNADWIHNPWLVSLLDKQHCSFNFDGFSGGFGLCLAHYHLHCWKCEINTWPHYLAVFSRPFCVDRKQHKQHAFGVELWLSGRAFPLHVWGLLGFSPKHLPLKRSHSRWCKRTVMPENCSCQIGQ